MNPEDFSYSFSWTQPYYGYTWPDPIKQINVMNEIARMDFLEEQIQSMTSYPDAEKIIHQIMGRQSDG